MCESSTATSSRRSGFCASHWRPNRLSTRFDGGGVSPKTKRACQVCGTALYDDSDPCPVCALRGALGNEQSISESSTEPTLSPSQLRFEHYQILTLDDGTPLELGRGAMGVTYKAVDVNLHCPVTLKVISERYLGDDSARLRFLREARAAARVRHPNVPSVFHLGRNGQHSC